MTETSEQKEDLISDYARAVSTKAAHDIYCKFIEERSDFFNGLQKLLEAEIGRVVKKVSESCLRSRFTGSPLISETQENR